MSKVYFFVDEDGTEGVSNTLPERHKGEGNFWIAPIEKTKYSNNPIDDIVELPQGTILALFGKNITWEDNPIMIEF